ncbi:MAG: hypothetical protein KC417_06010, partial [Myxococcales bacterium]|nr:hypothetical protein [Myxococcales bacterium]
EEVSDTKTDPLKADTDGDGLTDGEEVSDTKTDPLKPDTDGDGVNYGDEVENGTDPLSPEMDEDAGEPDAGMPMKSRFRGTSSGGALCALEPGAGSGSSGAAWFTLLAGALLAVRRRRR